MLVRRNVLVSVVSAIVFLATNSIASHAQSGPVLKQRNGTHVYLLRGFMNVFSYGLDELAEKLQRRGIQATLHSYTDGPELATTAIQDYKSGRARTIMIIGHSMGAGAAVEMADDLGHANVPVALVVTLDGGGGRTVPTNVKRLVNLYAANGMGAALNPPQGYRGTLINWQSKDPDMGHVGVAASPQLHQRVIGYVMSAMGGGQSAQARSDTAVKRDAPAAQPAAEGAEH
jgi:alpha-beta hydrolase superfamily lysophospholipase